MSAFHVPTQVAAVGENRKLSVIWNQLLVNIATLLNLGVPAAKLNAATGVLQPQTLVIPLAKLTSGGAQGSLTFSNGILTAYQEPS